MRRFLSRAVATSVACLGLGCSSGEIKTSFPQVEQTKEMLGDGAGSQGRLQHYQTCRQSAGLIEDLIRCMKDQGYGFIPRGPDYPASECWSVLEAGSELPQAFCFLRAPGSNVPASR